MYYYSWLTSVNWWQLIQAEIAARGNTTSYCTYHNLCFWSQGLLVTTRNHRLLPTIKSCHIFSQQIIPPKHWSPAMLTKARCCIHIDRKGQTSIIASITSTHWHTTSILWHWTFNIQEQKDYLCIWLHYYFHKDNCDVTEVTGKKPGYSIM